VKYGQLFKVLVIFLRSVLGEDINYLCVERQQPLVNGEADGYRGKAFADRVHSVRDVGSIGVSPGLESYFSVAQDHDAVKLYPAAFEIVEQFGYRLRGHADLFREVGSRERLALCSCGWHKIYISCKNNVHLKILPNEWLLHKLYYNAKLKYNKNV
jgi:hypothetical protein